MWEKGKYSTTVSHQKSVCYVIYKLLIFHSAGAGVHAYVLVSWLLHNCHILYWHFHYTDAAVLV